MDVLVLDTETTGLSAEKDRIIEIAAVEFEPRTGVSGETLHLLLDPGMPIPPDATAIHGITDARVAAQPHFIDVADRIVDFISEKTLVMHNANFDEDMLNAELTRNNFPTLDALNVTVVDSIAICRTLLPRLESYSLNTVCKHLCISLEERALHGAFTDVRLLMRVFCELTKQYDRLADTRGPRIETSHPSFFTQLSELITHEMETPQNDDPSFCETQYQRLNTLAKHLRSIVTLARNTVCAALESNEAHFPEAKVKRITRNTISWKNIVETHFRDADLSSYTSWSEYFRITSKTDHEVDAMASALIATIETFSDMHEALQMYLAIKAHCTPINQRLKTIKTQLTSAYSQGYSPYLLSFATQSRTTIAYKRLVESHGGIPNYDAFRKSSDVVMIYPGALTLCDQIF